MGRTVEDSTEHEARLLKRVEPQYPVAARRERLEGFVELRFTVSESGAVQDIEVLDAQPHGTFEQAAIAAVRRWKYLPRQIGTAPEPSEQRVRLYFRPD